MRSIEHHIMKIQRRAEVPNHGTRFKEIVVSISSRFSSLAKSHQYQLDTAWMDTSRFNPLAKSQRYQLDTSRFKPWPRSHRYQLDTAWMDTKSRSGRDTAQFINILTA
jgi:hypothetical protein